MKERITETFNLIIHLTILALLVLIPLVFWNLTTEFYEIPKFLLVAAGTALLLVILIVRSVLEGKLSFYRSALDLPFILLLVVFIISTFFAASRPIAILGNLPRIHGSLVTFVVYVLFYFTLVANLKSLAPDGKESQAEKAVVLPLLAAGLILSVLSLASYAGKSVLSFPFASALNFTPTGSSFSTTALLALGIPFLMENIFGKPQQKTDPLVKLMGKLLSMTVLAIFAATIVLTGTLATYVAATGAFLLAIFFAPTEQLKKNLPLAVLPALAAILLAILSFLPLGGEKNLFYTQAQNFPREIQLAFPTSWKVSISAFRDSPFWGSGPGTFLFDFTAYKPIEFNASKFWTIRFDQAFNEYLQILAVLGASGLIVLMLLTAVSLSLAIKALTLEDSQNKGVAVAAIVFFLLLLFHVSSLLVWVVGIAILALLVVTSQKTVRETHLVIGEVRKSEGEELNLNLHAFPLVLLLGVLVLVVGAIYFSGRYVLADFHHRQALNAVAANKGLDAYNELVAAERLNPYADLYRLDIAQTNFALANAIAVAKGPTEASPSGSLTDKDKQNIQQLLSQAINEGKVAVTLSPRNPVNWEVLGAIYRQISGVAQNALSFSLDSYGRAIQRDPLNPLLRMTVGGIYYSIKNYDLAVRFFTDAINLKPDYANAYYNLAITLREKGNLQEAQAVAERTVALIDPKNADYKLASDLLADIKTKLASQSAQAKQPETPQAATVATSSAKQTTKGKQSKTLENESQKGSSALQNQNLPQVLDLPQPENIATPPAVKKSQ